MSATPILDLIEEPPAPRSRRWMAFLPAAIGAAIGVLGVNVNLEPLRLPGNGLLWFPAIYLMVAIHELGHLLAGRMAGMAPGGLVVGGFTMVKSGDRWKFRFNWKAILGGGLAVPLPEKGNSQVEKFVWMVAGGPVASILSMLVCWIAWIKYGNGEWNWIGSCFWAAGLGLLSLIPISAGIHKSDGARIWSLLTKPDEARAWMAAVAVQAENMNGVRPREWDAPLVEQMMSVDGPGAGRVFPELFAYYRSLDEGDVPAALAHLECSLAASQKAGKLIRQLLYFEAAEVNALLLRNAERARVWLDRGLKLRKAECVACVNGAVAMSEGRFEDALRDIDETRAFLKKRAGNAGLVVLSRERLDQRERECREALSSGRATASASA